jgi:hypothetical protein
MTASERVTNHINELGDWRGKALARLRRLIHDAAPDLIEEWKWNTPLWSCNGNVVAVGAFQDHVKINFFKGASLDDPHRLFNAGLEAKASRAIDVHEDDRINEAALKDLVRAAVALNRGKPKTKTPTTQKKRMTQRTTSRSKQQKSQTDVRK